MKKKILWVVRNVITGGRLGVLQETIVDRIDDDHFFHDELGGRIWSTSDTMFDSAKRMFGPGIYLENVTDKELETITNVDYMCQHHDDVGVGDGYKSYIPTEIRPWLEEDDMICKNPIKYDF